jgi:hypothetical protein
METQVRTPQMVFMQPQRLVVPLFQRPYVWNEENQWDPLWNRTRYRQGAHSTIGEAPSSFSRRRCAAAGPEANRTDAGTNHHRWPTTLDNLAATA